MKDLATLNSLVREEKTNERKNNWEPPKEDFIKLNFEGALSTANQQIGMGRVLRDDKGDWINARARKWTLYAHHY